MGAAAVQKKAKGGAVFPETQQRHAFTFSKYDLDLKDIPYRAVQKGEFVPGAGLEPARPRRDKGF